MIWAAPLAWVLAIAAALPVIAHLWSRRRPRALAFPTLRFLRAASPVSRRLQQVHDWPLLLLRVAIVLLICAAAAGPTLTSAWRQRAWRDRLHRIIVVDDSVASAAARLVADEQRGAMSSVVLADDSIAGTLDDAVAAGTRAAREVRTEMVFVWDGSLAALTPADLGAVPAGLGIRLRTVAAPVDAPARSAATSMIAIDAAPSDIAARQRVEAAAQALRLPGAPTRLEVRWPRETPAGSQAEARPHAPPGTTGVVPALIRRALDEVGADVRVREAADRSRVDARGTGEAVDKAGRWLAQSEDLSPLLRGWFEASGRLVIALDAAPTSPLAWWSIVSARESLARLDRHTLTTRWSEGDLAAAQRVAPMPPLGAMPGGLDTRLAWAGALFLLLVEGAWRRRVRTPGAEYRPGTASPETGDAA